MRLRFDGFEIDRESCQLFREGIEVPLERRALDMLCYLAERPGRLVPREELLAEVWRVNTLSAGVLATTVSKLRKALGQAARAREPIETVHGRGYRLRAQPKAELHAPEPHETRAARLTRDPFVGRELVMATLMASLERARAGESQLVLISGEAGMGKTRLIHEEVECARSLGFRVWEGAALDGPMPAYFPWLEILRAAQAELGPNRLRALLPAGAPALARLLPELGAQPALGPEPDADASAFRLFDELARLLSKASEQGPLLLALDDLHWADLASLELLTHVARAVRKRAIFIIASVREHDFVPDEARAHALRRLGRLATRVALLGLSPDAVAHWLSSVQRDAQGAREAAAVLSERTQGNPLFIRQILELLAQRGEAAEPTVLRGMALPAAARDVIRQRLSALAPETRALLSAGSALGRELDADLLAALCTQSADHTLAQIECAQRAGILERHATIPQRFAFAHSMFVEVLYGDLAARARGALHARILALLSARAGAEDDAGRLSELAHHALNALPSELDASLHYCARAAAAAREASGFDRAAELSSQALEKLAREGGPEATRCELLGALGLDQFCAGHFRAAFQTLGAAADLAQKLEQPALLTRSVCDLADWSLLGVGSRSEVRERLEHAEQLVADRDSDLRALLLAHRAEMSHELSIAKRCTLLDEADAQAALRTTPAILIEVAVCRVSVRHATRLADNRAAAARARDLLKAHPRVVRVPYRAMWWLDIHFSDYYCALSDCDLAAADQAAARCSAIAAESQLSAHTLLSALLPAGRALAEGRLDALERQLRVVTGHTQALGRVSNELGSLGLAVAGYYQARLADARGELTSWGGDFLQLATRDALRSSAYVVATLWLAWLAVKTGRDDTARALLAAVPQAVLGQMPALYGELGLACLLAETYCELGDQPAAAALYARLVPHAELNAVGPCADYYGAVAHYLGLLAVCSGARDAALAHFTRAAQINEKLCMPLAAARSREQLRAR